MSYEMEAEDYISQHKAHVAALEEQVGILLAALKTRDEQIETQREQITRLTLGLDDALAIVRGYRAREEALKAEAEALEL